MTTPQPQPGVPTLSLSPREQARLDGVPEDQLHHYPDSLDTDMREVHQDPATTASQRLTPVPEPSRRVNLFSASTVKSEHLDWLIPNWIPHRSITLLAGREGLGKSTIASGIAAQATTGELTGRPINVAYVATEDSLSITVKPRLQAAGADLDRTFLLNVTTEEGREGVLSLPGDIHRLGDALKAHDVKLVILDAAKSAMHSSLDGYRDDDVRQFLEPLAGLCDALDIVVIGLVHFGKRESTDPGKLILGSIAWSQIARSVLSVAVDDEGTLVVTNTKGNLAPKQVSREARIESVPVPTDDGKVTEVGRIVWGNETDRSASELLVSHDDDDDRSEAEMIVVDFLISQGGSAPANDVRKQIMAAGLTWKTVQNNRKKWGVNTTQREGGWVWTLEQAHPAAMSRTRGGRDVGYEQVDTTKSRPEEGHIPRPTNDDTNRDVPENQPSLPMKSA